MNALCISLPKYSTSDSSTLKFKETMSSIDYRDFDFEFNSITRIAKIEALPKLHIAKPLPSANKLPGNIILTDFLTYYGKVNYFDKIKTCEYEIISIHL